MSTARFSSGFCLGIVRTFDGRLHVGIRNSVDWSRSDCDLILARDTLAAKGFDDVVPDEPADGIHADLLADGVFQTRQWATVSVECDPQHERAKRQGHPGRLRKGQNEGRDQISDDDGEMDGNDEGE